MRIGNPNWFRQLAGESDTGLLRELVVLTVFQFDMMRKNTEFLDRMNMNTALDILTYLENTSGKELDALYARMVGAQQ